MRLGWSGSPVSESRCFFVFEYLPKMERAGRGAVWGLGLHLQWPESMSVTPHNYSGTLWGVKEGEGQILHPDS